MNSVLYCLIKLNICHLLQYASLYTPICCGIIKVYLLSWNLSKNDYENMKDIKVLNRYLVKLLAVNIIDIILFCDIWNGKFTTHIISFRKRKLNILEITNIKFYKTMKPKKLLYQKIWISVCQNLFLQPRTAILCTHVQVYDTEIYQKCLSLEKCQV